MSEREALDTAVGMAERGEIPYDKRNVATVQLMGVSIIRGPMPKQVRDELNKAVKAGELGHIRKEGLRPEAYFHKNGRANALEARDRIFRQSVEALRGVFAGPEIEM